MEHETLVNALKKTSPLRTTHHMTELTLTDGMYEGETGGLFEDDGRSVELPVPWHMRDAPSPPSTVELYRCLSTYHACGLVFVHVEYKLKWVECVLSTWPSGYRNNWDGQPPHDHDDVFIIGCGAMEVELDFAREAFRQAIP